MTTYNYIFGTLGTEQVIDEIPCFGVVMDMEINKGGTFQGTYQLDMTGKDNDTLISASTPGRTWVAVERAGTCVWHGFIWSRVYSAQSKTLQLFGLSFDQYPRKRLVRTDFSYTATEQRNIFRDFWSTMQSATGGNLNINIPASFSTAAVLKDFSVLATDFKYYNEIMSEISDGIDGFDWYISCTKDGSLYRKDLLIGYPTLGVAAGDGISVFEYPGNITQYYMTEAMADSGTNVFVIGAGEGSSMITSEYINSDMYASGWPRWDVDISRKDISSQDAIDSFAMQEGINRRPPQNIIKLNVKGNLPPEFGSYSLGDSCRVTIKDPRNPGTFDSIRRLLKWDLRPESSDSVEEASLIFEGDPDV